MSRRTTLKLNRKLKYPFPLRDPGPRRDGYYRGYRDAERDFAPPSPKGLGRFPFINESTNPSNIALYWQGYKEGVKAYKSVPKRSKLISQSLLSILNPD